VRIETREEGSYVLELWIVAPVLRDG